MFVQNCWYVAGWSAGLVHGSMLPLTIIDEPVLLYRDANGRPVALEDRCCHRSAPLSKGTLEGECVRCPYHGLKFDRAGKCVEIPGQDVIPENAFVSTYPVVERNSWIWVWMGDPSCAHPDLIPQTTSLDDPAWDLRSGQMDYKANYELINDNLTDFSHLSFVHTNSFGASPTWALVRPRVKRIDRGIRVSRWLTGGATENRNVAGLAGRSAETPCTYISYDFLVPGVLIMRSETYRLEHYPADGISEPTARPVKANTTCQAVTPMTADSTRYFFSTGPWAGPGSAIVAEKLLEITKMAFEEDRDMIESQAALRKRKAGREMMTTADVGPVQFRSVIRRMLKAEADASVLEPVE